MRWIAKVFRKLKAINTKSVCVFSCALNFILEFVFFFSIIKSQAHRRPYERRSSRICRWWYEAWPTAPRLYQMQSQIYGKSFVLRCVPCHFNCFHPSKFKRKRRVTQFMLSFCVFVCLLSFFQLKKILCNRERADLAHTVDVMVDLGLTYSQSKNPDGTYQYQVEPDINVLCNFKGMYKRCSWNWPENDYWLFDRLPFCPHS